jgi:hypothetical protein
MKTLPIERFLELCYPRRSKEVQLEVVHYIIDVATIYGYTCSADYYGNLYVTVGDRPTTSFTSHIDNVNRSQELVNTKQHIRVEDGKAVVKEDSPYTCLGADDAAGIYIMLTMMSNKVKGLYCFFLDEEVGCLGSGYAAEHSLHKFEYITKMISFDRMGYKSVITHQANGRCCSDEFARGLCNMINTELCGAYQAFKPDSGGVFTDSNSFIGIIPECTNVSVGYNHQHTKREYQDLDFLQYIAEVYSSIPWEDLPVVGVEDGADSYVDAGRLLSEVEDIIDYHLYEDDIHDENFDRFVQSIQEAVDLYYNPDKEVYDLPIDYKLDEDPFYFSDEPWRT